MRNVLSVVNVINVLDVLCVPNVLDVHKDASLACWVLFKVAVGLKVCHKL